MVFLGDDVFLLGEDVFLLGDDVFLLGGDVFLLGGDVFLLGDDFLELVFLFFFFDPDVLVVIYNLIILIKIINKQMLENIWKKLPIICEDITFIKNDFYYMKHMHICYIMTELEFTTNFTEDKNEINIKIPDLVSSDFPICENTVFFLKNDNLSSIIKISLHPGFLKLTGFPLTPNTKYSGSVQFFCRLINHDRNAIINNLNFAI